MKQVLWHSRPHGIHWPAIPLLGTDLTLLGYTPSVHQEHHALPLTGALCPRRSTTVPLHRISAEYQKETNFIFSILANGSSLQAHCQSNYITRVRSRLERKGSCMLGGSLEAEALTV